MEQKRKHNEEKKIPAEESFFPSPKRLGSPSLPFSG
jgi:hypothetical protein